MLQMQGIKVKLHLSNEKQTRPGETKRYSLRGGEDSYSKVQGEQRERKKEKSVITSKLSGPHNLAATEKNLGVGIDVCETSGQGREKEAL